MGTVIAEMALCQSSKALKPEATGFRNEFPHLTAFRNRPAVATPTERTPADGSQSSLDQHTTQVPEQSNAVQTVSTPASSSEPPTVGEPLPEGWTFGLYGGIYHEHREPSATVTEQHVIQSPQLIES